MNSQGFEVTVERKTHYTSKAVTYISDYVFSFFFLNIKLFLFFFK